MNLFSMSPCTVVHGAFTYGSSARSSWLHMIVEPSCDIYILNVSVTHMLLH